jgi:hypothetical protein
MTPLLTGVFASQISGHLFNLTGAYDALSTVTVPSGGASSITFSAIPQTGYKHLQIRFIANNASNTYQKIQFNSDTTGANYYAHNLYGTGSVAGASALAGTSYSAIAMGGGGLGSGSYFGAGVIDILDYANGNKFKTIKTLDGFDTNGGADGQFIELQSGVWQSTSAINTIKIFGNGSNYNQYTQFSLYGIK